jgi:hypothetical protein
VRGWAAGELLRMAEMEQGASPTLSATLRKVTRDLSVEVVRGFFSMASSCFFRGASGDRGLMLKKPGATSSIAPAQASLLLL